jgi:hypothetical protein
MMTVVMFVSAYAVARDLEAAATAATSKALLIGQSASVLGLVSGGILMNVPGAGDWGKRIASAGLVGSICTFGAKSFTGMLQQVFG